MVKGIYGIVARDRNKMGAISHDDVLALAHNPEAGFFKCLNRPEMVHTGKLRHC